MWLMIGYVYCLTWHYGIPIVASFAVSGWIKRKCPVVYEWSLDNRNRYVFRELLALANFLSGIRHAYDLNKTKFCRQPSKKI
jgi:hypothetical protein